MVGVWGDKRSQEWRTKNVSMITKDIQKCWVKLATVVEEDLEVPFSIATTPWCRGGRYSFHWIFLVYPWSVPYNAECKANMYQAPFFESLVRLPGIEPMFLRPLANTLTIMTIHLGNIMLVSVRTVWLGLVWFLSFKKRQPTCEEQALSVIGTECFCGAYKAEKKVKLYILIKFVFGFCYFYIYLFIHFCFLYREDFV